MGVIPLLALVLAVSPPPGQAGESEECASALEAAREANRRRATVERTLLSRNSSAQERRRAKDRREQLLREERDHLKRQRDCLWRTGKYRFRGRGYPEQRRALRREVEQLERELERAVSEGSRARIEARLEQARDDLRSVETELAARGALRREKLANQDAIGETRDVRVSPLVGPAYTPELGFLVAGGVLLSFRGEPANRSLPRSSLPINLAVTSTGAVVGRTKLTGLFFDDWIRVDAQAAFARARDHYWGTGYRAGRRISLEGPATEYERTTGRFNATLLGRLVLDGLFAGPSMDIQGIDVRRPSRTMPDDPAYVRAGDKVTSSGLGGTLRIDTRDVPYNPWEGTYAQIQFLTYDPALGSDQRFQVLDLDWRQYFTLGDEGRTLAYQLRLRRAFGDVPWSAMGQLGSANDLRGYYQGRYRDASIAYGLVEYRHEFRRREPDPSGRILSRHGAVAWLGAGSLGPRVRDFTRWLPNAGVGYRFELQPRLNLRLDVGFGTDSAKVYFNFEEAF